MRGLGAVLCGLLVAAGVIAALHLPLVQRRIELRLRGNYPDLVSFMRRLPRLVRLVRVDRVEMERLLGPQFELRLRVTVFYGKV